MNEKVYIFFLNKVHHDMVPEILAKKKAAPVSYKLSRVGRRM